METTAGRKALRRETMVCIKRADLEPPPRLAVTLAAIGRLWVLNDDDDVLVRPGQALLYLRGGSSRGVGCTTGTARREGKKGNTA